MQDSSTGDEEPGSSIRAGQPVPGVFSQMPIKASSYIETDISTPAAPAFPVTHKTYNGDLPARNKTERSTRAVPAKKQSFRNPGFPENEAARAFRKRFSPDATRDDWSDWGWQVRHRVRDLKALSRIIQLSPDEKEAVTRHRGSLPIGITPYYASLLSETDPTQPLRMTHIPVMGEYVRAPGEDPDPLNEDHDTATPGLVHRYPDRVLFLTTGFCSTYCRYCTRSRMVGETNGVYSFSVSQWEKAAQYIEAHPEIRDCLPLGRRPALDHGDDKLEWLLARLRSIKHLEFTRIGTT